jgi:hypothetical protein
MKSINPDNFKVVDIALAKDSTNLFNEAVKMIKIN